MRVTIDIPDQLSQIFGSDLSLAAKEALLIEAYRRGRISLGFLTQVLGLATRLEAQNWLADRQVPLNYDLEELEADRQALRDRYNVDL